MSNINILDISTANLIAAGEVVERPAGAVKELLENSADAHSKTITVEIKNGGTSLLRVTDDGCGMSAQDLEKCILRHATSKIKVAEDLENISTMGFRGEALAAISAVSDMRILSKQAEGEFGNVLYCSYGALKAIEQAGCPDGTTVICEDLFKNVPARRKFLKKDFTEASAVVAVCEKFALSRPDISVTVISDGDRKFQSPGNGNLYETVYAVLGKEVAKAAIKVENEYASMRVHGYILRPEFSRGNRNMQNFFINNRYVRSKTMMAALEEGFHSFCPVGKYPCCVLMLDMPPYAVDVNIHPSKLEVKFSDDRKVFDIVFFAVRNALSKGLYTQSETGLQQQISQQQNNASVGIDKAVQTRVAKERIGVFANSEISDPIEQNIQQSKRVCSPAAELSYHTPTLEPLAVTALNIEVPASRVEIPVVEPVKDTDFVAQQPAFTEQQNTQPEFEYIGEAFDTYLLVQKNGELFVIDKHAAHERILYEKLKSGACISGAQNLLLPLTINLTYEETATLNNNKKYFSDIGFDFEAFGTNTVILRACPMGITESEAHDIFCDLLEKCQSSNNKAAADIFDKALYSAACKAALKAGQKNDRYHNEWIVKQLFENEAVLYCPHGRPVILGFTREKLDKMFKRT